MYKIIFGYWGDKQIHPGYEYLKTQAREEGWSGTSGLKEMVQEKWNARLYFRDGEVYGIGFKDAVQYNTFCVNAGIDTNLELF